jgi:hypothetical protein
MYYTNVVLTKKMCMYIHGGKDRSAISTGHLCPSFIFLRFFPHKKGRGEEC